MFLCTGNSCRSQMAEGLARAFGPGSFNYLSAGTKKHGLNPNAVKVMAEIDVDISGHISKTTDELTDELPDETMDYVITVCSDADENCPVFPGGKVIHYGFDDPPRLTKDMSDEEEVLSVYRRVRDEIKEFVMNIEEHIKRAEIG